MLHRIKCNLESVAEAGGVTEGNNKDYIVLQCSYCTLKWVNNLTKRILSTICRFFQDYVLFPESASAHRKSLALDNYNFI
jgi:hypothetical protein